ncbi:MAG: fibronectin type III domain-containing protein, partial [Candidatus Aenigmarchaeota archaeon]|nr:fibronectin type III domain-containing protein [Candidatus Aenigmarchaeota archaeon]
MNGALQRAGLLLASIIFLASTIAYIALTIALPGAPTAVHFEGNATKNFDNDGNFSVNWTTPSGDGIANYTIFRYYTNSSLIDVTTNDSFTGKLFASLPEGNYTFNITAVNGTGDQGNYTVNASSDWLYVDLTDPTNLAYTTPTPGASANISQAFLSVNLTFTENNTANCVFAVDGSNSTTAFNTTVANNRSCEFTSGTLIEGLHTYRVYVNDSATRSAASANRTFVIDTYRPTVNQTFANVSLTRSNIAIRINATVLDNGTGVFNVTAGSAT